MYVFVRERWNFEFHDESLWDAAIDAKALVTAAKYNTLACKGTEEGFFWSACEYFFLCVSHRLNCVQLLTDYIRFLRASNSSSISVFGRSHKNQLCSS